MFKKTIQSIFLICFTFLLFHISENSFTSENPNPRELVVGTVDYQKLEILKTEPTIQQSENIIVGEEYQEEIDVISQPVIFPDSYYNPEIEAYNEEEFWDDMELIALVCVAEAEGESEYGKRLVIDTILNRMESEYYPNTIHEVVYAPGQYECVYNGRIDHVEYNEEIANLVIDEFNNRTNNEVIYFRTGYYFNFGRKLFKEGNHYFNAR